MQSLTTIRQPYLWVVVWVLILLCAGVAFWYFSLRAKTSITSEGWRESNRPGGYQAHLEELLPAVLGLHSSVTGTSTARLSSADGKKIAVESSVVHKGTYYKQQSLMSADREALIRSSSAR
jgi:hypothetical protein